MKGPSEPSTHRPPAPERHGLYAAIFVALFGIATTFLIQPLHAQGMGQPLTGYLNGLDHLLQFPGKGTTWLLGLDRRGVHHQTGGSLLLSNCLNIPIYFGLGWYGGILRQRWRRLRPPAYTERSAAGAPVTRRRFLGTAVNVAGGSVLAGAGYSFLVEPRWFGVTHQVFPIRGLPPELDGLRAVQLTDLHHGPWLALRYLRQVVDAANELEPDLFLLTGDYTHQSPVYIGPAMEELARLRPRLATLAVLGNHDWWEDGEQTQRGLTAAGAVLLDNRRCVLTPDRELVADATAGLALCGVGDLWMDRPVYARALGGLPRSLPRLLLSHNPDVAEERELVLPNYRVDLMISGHTHGGQIYVPGLGRPVVPSRFGQKYAQGVVQGPLGPVFVCRGIGLTVLPLRLGVAPEIAVLEFRAA